MKDLTDQLMSRITPARVSAALRTGWHAAHGGKLDKADLAEARDVYAEIRSRYGFKRIHGPLLTAPSENLKLDKGEIPAYGITLQHYVTRLTTGLTVNACPKAGDCIKVCVLDNGQGRYDSVQRARKAKTELFATAPTAAFILLGWEIERAVIKHSAEGIGTILLRPNVNSDIEWELAAPALVDGSVFGESVKFYGYTKHTAVLSTDGWLTPHYRVAYSWNENSDEVVLWGFLGRGGSCAVVTDRKPKTAIKQWTNTSVEGVVYDTSPLAQFPVLDADKSDEWIFEAGVIGDLSAKGKARNLIGKSGFVVSV